MGEEPESKIFAIRTVINREREVAELIEDQNDYKDLSLKAILVSPRTSGYVYAEATSEAEILRATEDVKLVKDVIEKPASREDLEKILNPRPPVADVSYGDTVEIINGEFKGERGKVANISHSEEEVTVRMKTTAVSFSTTVGMDEVKPVEGNRA
ncbi:hypothetical protein AKJ62_03680 [candidate division MSBL1 archaeon SCGC-AAA259D14]|uniref:Transcription elongation factor Spt5 n=1 Tax=candidate division MSBL1 archaeon SCGC-AAA259D14 TaxID=1698261 RepID=A0A133U4P3_9EURY|nr:hypothetical protein AKJ62_03680 [candidate division MSBL1 archaeon SCGC-AAA259D14]